MKTVLSHIFLLSGLLVFQSSFAKDEHNHQQEHNLQAEDHTNKHHDDDEHNHAHKDENSSYIDEHIAEQVGIQTKSTSSQQLHQTIVSYGSLTTDPEQLGHVRARYTGLITDVKATIGDKVKAGELLAMVESNESLKKYRIESPVSGTVIQRHANKGEVTQDQVLFSIANFDTLWAEFRIYPGQQAQVKEGQSVHITVNNQLIKSKIEHIIPALNRPYQLARVKIKNNNLGLSPGLLVEGYILTAEFSVDLAVNLSAIQTLEGQEGVFVKQNNEYIFRPLVLGRSDDNYVEVLQGLQSNQLYVYENSYLIKADIEKSEAEHVH